MNTSKHSNKHAQVSPDAFEHDFRVPEVYRNSLFQITKNDLATEFRQPLESSGGGSLPTQERARCVLAYFVLPSLSAFYWIFLTPHRITYETSSAKYVKLTGSVLRKVICAVVAFLIVVYYIGQLRLLIGSTSGGAIAILFNITYIIFILCTVSSLYVMWFRMDRILQLFVQIDCLQHHFVATGMQFPRRRKIRILKWFIYAVFAFVSFGYPIFIAEKGRIFRALVENGLTLHSLNEIAKMKTHIAFLTTCPLIGIDYRNGIEKMSDTWIIPIALVYEFIEYASGCVWILGNLIILMWGFVFHKILTSFLLKSKANRYLGGRVLEDIRDFNSVTQIFDTFNGIMGLLTFFIVVAAILYISVTSGSMFLASDGNSEVNTVIGIVYVTSFTPFVAVLCVASEVNKMASEFPALLKRMYNNQNGVVWSKAKDSQLEILQGLAIVHYDLTNNAVGFQGLGFFTISYSFIGTVISVISSYAVVALQFNSTPSSTSDPLVNL